MAVDLLLALVGLVLLVKAADQFVLGAARVSVALRVSPVVIGAVVVGFGTSAPEMLVSALAGLRGQTEIGVGNIVGSNVANLTLVLGAAALIVPISISSTTLRREAPLSVASVCVFAFLVQNGLTRIEGVIFLVLLVAALGYILMSARSEGSDELTAEVDEFLDGEPPRLPLEVGRTIGGLLVTLLGAQLLVSSAESIASELGLTGGFIGLTLVAVGTSLPELVTAIAAARQNEHDLIVGNLLGSNIFNSLAVGAAAALAGPGPIDSSLTGVAVIVMVAVSIGSFALMTKGQKVIGRTEGAVLLAAFALSQPLFLDATSKDADDESAASIVESDRSQLTTTPGQHVARP